MCGEAPSRDEACRIAANFGKLRDFDVSGMTVHSAGTLNRRSNWHSDGW